MGEPVPVQRQDEPPPVHSGQVVEPWRPFDRDLWSPFREMDNMLSRVMRAFDAPGLYRWTGAFVPAVDVEETEDAYIFEIELPGMRRDDISIEVSDTELHVSGQVLDKERTGVLRQRNRRMGAFDYRASLPSGVDPDRTEARFDDGVLTIRLPRSESTRPRRIKIV